MSRLWVGRCPGCGIEFSVGSAPPSDDLWCDRCCDRIAQVGRTTLPGTLARALDWLARRLDGWEIRLRMQGERVAEELLRTSSWFRGRFD